MLRRPALALRPAQRRRRYEDQDGDFVLDSVAGVRTAESFVRYVFPIGDDRYFVRDGGMVSSPSGGASGWRLYRIPFRTDTLQIGAPSLRQGAIAADHDRGAAASDARHAGPAGVFRLVARPTGRQLVVKRSDTPLAGIGGERGTGFGEVVASVVSTENRDLGYTPPPGVVNQAGRRDANFQIGSSEINERSCGCSAGAWGAASAPRPICGSRPKATRIS